ncbi:MAG: twin-arginine translocation signal domain-containing protein [Pirellulales bacterium]|nr:twin-arginine translocation signal domain-containing protein [Pirellulales bacterium]
MRHVDWDRRRFLKTAGLGSAALALSGQPMVRGDAGIENRSLLTVDPRPKFELSPYLYMQFMEPLGTTDTSVDAAWNFTADRWREDVVEITQELAPTLIRWGGCFCSYYRWKEGVGPREQRRPMLNLLWGGIYNNQVGTHEFLDFCRRVGAEGLIVVNFESDGRKSWAISPKGDLRSGNAQEAAEWVDYCNNPANAMRLEHGVRQPYGVKLWQIGNETSYDPNAFDVETAAKKTLEFARAMRKADPQIKIIGWGDSGWAERMAEIAGEELQYLAFHNGLRAGGEGSPLQGIEYRRDPAKTWHYLMKACEAQEQRIRDVRGQIARFDIPLAMTECHFILSGRNRCEVLSSWAAGVANARTLNVHERHGDVLKIATLADFCGTRWQNNAVMIPVPHGRSFMMPVAMVMSLYRKHVGNNAVTVLDTPDDLDVTASRTGDRVFLHVVNTNRTRSVNAAFRIQGADITTGRVYWYDLDPELEVFQYRPEHTFPRESPLNDHLAWTFPAASVSAVELSLQPA